MHSAYGASTRGSSARGARVESKFGVDISEQHRSQILGAYQSDANKSPLGSAWKRRKLRSSTVPVDRDSH